MVLLCLFKLIVVSVRNRPLQSLPPTEDLEDEDSLQTDTALVIYFFAVVIFLFSLIVCLLLLGEFCIKMGWGCLLFQMSAQTP